ncbi:hypothetical protein ACIRP7_20340 [Streptomyces sp. NPDC102270]|uniref:hypothetical protein n=1 Tax=Streptomyces sp. NPDC102270 TaxID=3366150 RepID=UPI0037FC6520
MHRQHLVDRTTRLGTVGAYSLEHVRRRRVGHEPTDIQAGYARGRGYRRRGSVRGLPEHEHALPQSP